MKRLALASGVHSKADRHEVSDGESVVLLKLLSTLSLSVDERISIELRGIEIAVLPMKCALCNAGAFRLNTLNPSPKYDEDSISSSFRKRFYRDPVSIQRSCS